MGLNGLNFDLQVFCRVRAYLPENILHKIIKRVYCKILSTRICSPSEILYIHSPKLVLKMSTQGEQLHANNSRNFSHSHIHYPTTIFSLEFCIFFRGMCVVQVQLQVLLFYLGMISTLWRETITISKRVHFPKGKSQSFHQPHHWY